MKYKLGRCNVSYLPECTFGYFQLSVCSLPSLNDAIVLVQIELCWGISISILNHCWYIQNSLDLHVERQRKKKKAEIDIHLYAFMGAVIRKAAASFYKRSVQDINCILNSIIYFLKLKLLRWHCTSVCYNLCAFNIIFILKYNTDKIKY